MVRWQERLRIHYGGERKRDFRTLLAKDGFKSLNEGQAVEFEVGSGAKGEQAINVTVVE